MTHLAHVKSNSEYSEYTSDVERSALAALAAEKAESGALTIVLTDREQMQTLNREFSGKDIPTDVLSFPDGTVDPDLNLMYFGDIIIAVPIAQAQAKRAEHSTNNELMLLTVHGTLHLLGFDHILPQDKDRMWIHQERILDQLGITIQSLE
ncbi:MAG: rRNA maturation RNase YbeY [Anaerolineales bacterium]|jgi:probable rRNA maturation factor|nr:MAG: rRNA maturation RNase YbeY [Anaerolineales bacterium]